MEEDTMPTDKHTEAPWQLVLSSKSPPQETIEASLDTMDYDDRVFTMRLALRAASPNSRQKIAEEYSAMLAEDPLCSHLTAGKFLAKILPLEAHLSPA
jgi:hypothetical protein